jgi:hypothetical protein
MAPSMRNTELLHDALLNAFRTSAALEKLVAFSFSTTVETVAGGKTLAEQVLNLLNYADSQGQLQTLLEKALQVAPGNELLAYAYEKEIGKRAAPVAASPVLPPAQPAGGTAQPAATAVARRDDRLHPTVREYLVTHMAGVGGLLLAWSIALAVTFLLEASLLRGGLTLLVGAVTAQVLLLLELCVCVFILWPADHADEQGVELRRAFVADPENGPFAANAIKSQRQIYRAWRLLLLSWLVLYGLLLLRLLRASSDFQQRLIEVGLTSLSNAASLFIFVCFFIMRYVTTVSASDQDPSPGAVPTAARSLERAYWCGWLLFTVFFAANLEVVLSADQQTWHQSHELFEMASGVAAAVIFGLWAARFDSKYIDARPVVILLLYLYVAIQPCWVFLAALPKEQEVLGVISQNSAKAILIISATFLKAVLFVTMSWLLHTGRLVFYFGKIRMLCENICTEWDSQFGLRYSQITSSRLDDRNILTYFLLSLAAIGFLFVGAGRISDMNRARDPLPVAQSQDKDLARLIALTGEGSQTKYVIEAATMIVKLDPQRKSGDTRLVYTVFALSNLGSGDFKEDFSTVLPKGVSVAWLAGTQKEELLVNTVTHKRWKANWTAKAGERFTLVTSAKWNYSLDEQPDRRNVHDFDALGKWDDAYCYPNEDDVIGQLTIMIESTVPLGQPQNGDALLVHDDDTEHALKTLPDYHASDSEGEKQYVVVQRWFDVRPGQRAELLVRRVR